MELWKIKSFVVKSFLLRKLNDVITNKIAGNCWLKICIVALELFL